DLAEGGRLEDAAHLEACETCRARLSELRAAMSAVEKTAVPEPSPLFWDQFAARVREAIAREPEPTSWWAGVRGWLTLPSHVAMVVGAAAALILVLVVPAWNPADVNQQPSNRQSSGLQPPAIAALAPLVAGDDESLAFVVGLASQMDEALNLDSGVADHE